MMMYFLLEVGQSPVFPLASSLLAHGRSGDFFCTALDHYLTLGRVLVAGNAGGANLPTKAVAKTLYNIDLYITLMHGVPT